MKKGIKVIILLSVGLVIGFINGFMGAGGGILLVPALQYIIKEDTKKAHATAVAIILPLCIVSAIVYAVKGFIDTTVLWPVLIGTIFGGVTGTILLKKLKSNWISLIFSVIMIVAGALLIFRK
ncbi:MAG: sulfite exporter TauE/SafE family protein [Clostridia bacterium]